MTAFSLDAQAMSLRCLVSLLPLVPEVSIHLLDA